MNSTSATGTPARRAMARPSAVASAGLVVTAKSWPAPPVASTVWRARPSPPPPPPTTPLPRCPPPGVGPPGRGMGPLAGEIERAPGLAIELRTHGDQFMDPERSLVDQDPHRVGVAQTCARGQGVGQMKVGRILVPTQYRGHAALGPPGGRTP